MGVYCDVTGQCYLILWPDFMWYACIWSPNGDQPGKWGSISMISQWPFIMTSQWVMMLWGTCIVKSQWVMTLLGTSIVKQQWVDMCTYHGITMHNDIAMNLFYYVLSVVCLIMILLWVVCNKNTSSCLISLGWRTHSLFLCRAISTQTQLMCSAQTDHTLTCSCYNIEHFTCCNETSTTFTRTK